MLDIDGILRELVNRRGSDLHLKVGRPPLTRISGELLPTELPPVTREDVEHALRATLGEKGWSRLVEHTSSDGNYHVKDLARFRINAFWQMGQPGAVLRAIPLKIPTIDGMALPPVLKDIVAAPQGMVLVTGATGSGKSTSLAAMINHLNETENIHIITIEDPIEFVYSDNKCTINQRNLGTDIKTLHEALRGALRQDPDVILMGEMRDPETIEMAMHAAETGHLVFSTLHTNDCKQTLDRIVDTFPPEAHHQVRSMLAITLHSVISQRLVKRADGAGRTAAMEIMINTPFIRELLAEGKTTAIDKEIMKGAQHYRMQTFNMALAKLVQDNTITEEEALANSASPSDLKLLLKGFVTASTMVAADTRKIQAEREAAAQSKAGEAAPTGKPAAEAPSPPKLKISRGF